MPSPWKVHFALLDEAQQAWEGLPHLERQAATLARTGGEEFAAVNSPEEADAVVFLESNGYKDWRSLARLLAHPALRDHPGRCFTLNYADTPVTFFPGAYVNLPQSRQRSDWSRPIGYYAGNPNPLLADYEHARTPPEHLFSFRGADSHSLRRRLFERAAAWRRHGPVSLIPRWFNHTPEELRDYCQEIVLSRFVLCPRGIGVATHRFFEVMRLGRVPVIIADDWARPAGPDWTTFTITIPEAALDELPRILANASAQATAMGLLARKNWEIHFAPETALVGALRSLRALAQTRTTLPAPDFAARWRSLAFRREHGWTLPQRLLHRALRVFDKAGGRT